MNTFWKHEPSVDRDIAMVHRRITAVISQSRGYIRPYLEQMTANQGKMLRPACVLLCFALGDTGEGDKDLALDLAAGIELIHMASLVHDDIIDEAPLRRGEQTLHRRIGNRKAVVAGDYLMARAFSLFSGSSVKHIDAKRVSDRISRLCESEIDQDSEIGNFSITVTHYLRRIGGKTASLFSLACYLGGAAAELPPLQVRRLARFGYNMGMSFQIQDDILDYSGSPEQMGKEAVKDLRQGIATLPLLCALAKDTSSRLAERIFPAGMDDRELERAVLEVVNLGGVKEAGKYSRRYLDRALRDLNQLPQTDAARILEDLLHRLTARRK